jgi:thiamine pyrophosphate-dependent acetolactate synthase large subunit-like protein
MSGVAAAGASAGLLSVAAAPAKAGPQSEAPAKQPYPTAAQVAVETAPPLVGAAPLAGTPGSDYMVDVIKSLGIDYVAAMPGSAFRGLHESIINYGANTAPELLTCLHEEGSVGMAHGYAKVAGKPMAVLAHGTVGLQHAAMAVYNAWCDRAAVVMLAGNILDATRRRPGVEWTHAVQDAAAFLRDCTKWDDQPMSVQHFAESLVRGYKIAVTPPMGPVLLVVDAELQERPHEGEAPNIPPLAVPFPPQGDANAVAEVAKLLAAAENPVIYADRLARTPQGMASLIELAELLSAPVVDKLGRMNFPTTHDLNHTDLGVPWAGQADVILGLELADFWGTVNQVRDLPRRESRVLAQRGAKLISISTGDLYMKSNYQDFQRYAAVDIAIAGDGEATLPSLIEAVRRVLRASQRNMLAERRERHRKTYLSMRQKARLDATYAWNATPISTARMHVEMWRLIRDEDWALVSEPFFQSFWPQRLWNFERHHQYIGGSGGYGVGYGIPAAVGAALGHREHGRLVINVQGDGDFMCLPGMLWTAAHHKIPLLTIMHNNRSYHQEVMHVQRMANRRERGIDRCQIGNAIDDPAIDYAKIAQGMGVWAEAPITDPNDFAPALKRAIDVVKQGEPALVDVVSQAR